MKDLLKNRVLKFLLWAVGILLLAFLFYALSDVLIIAAVSILLAFIFNPFVTLLESRGFNRFFSVLLVFLSGGLVIFLGLSFIIPGFLYQLNHLIETLQVYSLHDQIVLIEKEIHKFLPIFTPGTLAKRIEQVIFSQFIIFIDQISEVLSSIVSIIAILVIVPFITFFLLKDSRSILQGIINVMPNKYFEMSYWILKKITLQLGRFVRAWIFDAAFVGMMCGVGFYIIGVPYALPLGVIAGIGHLIPYFGPVIGGIPAIIISIIQYGDLSHVPLIIFLIICVYAVDNGFVQPVIFSKSVDMHPIFIILLIISGSHKKRGAVVGISGGIDSSVVLALCVKAFGPDKVIGIMIPEKDSSVESMSMARILAEKYNVKTIIEDISGALTGFNCYGRRDEAVKKVFPEYDSSYKMKISLSSPEKNRLNYFSSTIISPEGTEKTERLPLAEYLQIVAASNFKQRSRMSILYYHAELRNYAVIGTGNKNEHEQGFFVKYGDGGADIKPIAHLFKTQVYQLAKHLEIPEKIISRTPTTDTYTAEQTQEEFFFQLPFDILDRVWFAMEQNYTPEETAEALNLTPDEVYQIMEGIKQKIRSTEYLRCEPLTIIQKSMETAL